MQFLYYALFAAGIVAVDQLSKYFTVAYIPLYTDISFIPGVLNLTYVQNSGAAFSSFEGQQWLFALIFLFFTGLIVWEYFKKKMAFTPFERWCIAAIYGLRGGHDRDGLHGLPRVQCGGLLHHLRLRAADGTSGAVQQGILEG